MIELRYENLFYGMVKSKKTKNYSRMIESIRSGHT